MQQGNAWGDPVVDHALKLEKMSIEQHCDYFDSHQNIDMAHICNADEGKPTPAPEGILKKHRMKYQ